MNCYCIYCDASKCDKLSILLEKLIDCRVIIPMRIQHTWSNGRMADIEKPLIPGYLFIYSEDQVGELDNIERITGIYKILRYSDGRAELRNADQDFAKILFEQNGVIGKVPVYRVGDRIVLEKGILKGTDAKIVKVDKRNSRMQLEIKLASTNTKMWLEYCEL